MLEEIAAKGRFGDTELVHVNEEEKALLKALGGAGTINPETGLEEYFSFSDFNPWKQAKKIAKVFVGGVEKVADDVLGIDDSGGIVGSVKKIGDKIGDGLTEVGDELKKISENPYVQLAVAVAFPAYAPYVNAAVKLNSGEKLNAADIAAVAASAGQQDFADGLKLSKTEINNITKAAKVATAKNPGQAFLTTFGADVAQKVGLTDAFDTTVASTFGDDALEVFKQNENYIVDTARYASGNMSEKELVAKYGAGAIDYATSGTAANDYNDLITDAVNVGFGVKGVEEVIADKYGEQIVDYLGAESTNERAVGLGGLTTATQLAMGKDRLEAAYAGTKRAYDEGARLEDLTFVPQQVANLDFGLNDIVTNLGIDFPELKGQGYELPQLADLGINLPSLGGIETPELISNFQLPEVANLGFDIPSLDLSGYKPTDLGYEVGEWGKLKDLGVDFGQLDLGDYNLGELADLNLDLEIPELDLALQNLGQQPSQFASLGMDSDLTGDGFELQIAEDSETPLSRRLLESV